MQWNAQWTDIAAKIGGSLIVAVLTAILTVRGALKKFRSEKWWEKRSDAYTAIMEALHHIKEQAENERAAEHHGANLPKDLAATLATNVQKATAEIRLRRDVGSFVISKDAVDALNLLLKDLETALKKGLADDDAGYYSDRISATDRAMDRLREIARRHLNLP